MREISLIFAAFLIFFVSCVVCVNIRHLDSRIVNGSLSEANQFPFVVRLALYHSSETESGRCTGTLIAVDWVLTAAHCLENVTFAQIFFGHTIHPKQHSVNVSTKDFKIHEKYTGKNGLLNDIGLIRIPNVVLSDSIKLIKLPKIVDKNPSFNGKKVVFAGWGTSRDKHRNVLHYTEMRVMSRQVCHQHFKSDKKQICAAGKISATCFGDSGGPLILNTSDGPLQIGVNSLLISPFCGKEHPGVYIRTSHYSKWIANVTGITL